METEYDRAYMEARKKKKRRRKRRQALRKIVLAELFLAVVLSLFMLLFVMFWKQDTGVESENLVLFLDGNSLHISWEQTGNLDSVRLYRKNEATGKNEEIGEFREYHTVLSNVSSGKAITLVFEPITKKTLFGHTFTFKNRSNSVTFVPRQLNVPTLSCDVNDEEKTIDVKWLIENGATMELYSVDDNNERTLLAEESGMHELLTVGQQVLLPDRTHPISLQGRIHTTENDITQYSDFGPVCTVAREELLSDTLSLECSFDMDGKYSFSWEESKENMYEFQQQDPETNQWITLGTYAWNDPLTMQVDWLPSETFAVYRLLAYNLAEGSDEKQNLRQSNTFNVRAKRSPLYCNIWPIMKLNVYASADSDEVIETVNGGTSLCVLEDTGKRFKVRIGETYGYIDSAYCLINLPDYLGDMCGYNITNSYASAFKVHEYNIPSITNAVVKGFENICLSEEDQTFIVPYLYPCANKLADAAEAASKDGYMLYIYEAYRPHETTRYIYDMTEAILSAPVPFVDENGEEIRVIIPEMEVIAQEEEETSEDKQKPDPYDEYFLLLAQQNAIAEGFDITTDIGMLRVQQLLPLLKIQMQAQQLTLAAGIDPNSEEGKSYAAALVAQQPTYEIVMTNNSHNLGAFLAKVASAHNRGIALDLTIVQRSTGEELIMQSAMHDLSWNSVVGRDNENAKILEKYMTGAGFAGLSSEWWHFQDNETRESINLTTYLEGGVSVEGWKCNDRGWRYRLANGEYLKDTTQKIDSTEYSFDEKGYCTPMQNQ